MTSDRNNRHPILLFDGFCNLCSASVIAVIKRDSASQFSFASLQSDLGQSLLAEYGLLDQHIDSVVLVHEERCLIKSDAVLRVCGLLGGFYGMLVIFKVVPRSIRDMIYDWIARNRFTWFGKRDRCMIPTPELKDRFLD